MVVGVFAYHRAMGGDDGDFEVVDFGKLFTLGVGGTRHTSEFFVHAEEVLVGNRGQGDVFLAGTDSFFGFDGLMQPITPTSTSHFAAGKFIDDDHFAIGFDDIIVVAVVDELGAQGVFEVVGQFVIFGVIQILGLRDAQQAFHFEDALHRHLDAFGAWVNHEVAIGVEFVFFDLVWGKLARCQVAHQLSKPLVFLAAFLSWSRNNQRCAGFVNQNIVDFVDNGKIEGALYQLLLFKHHVVA